MISYSRKHVHSISNVEFSVIPVSLFCIYQASHEMNAAFNDRWNIHIFNLYN